MKQEKKKRTWRYCPVSIIIHGLGTEKARILAVVATLGEPIEQAKEVFQSMEVHHQNNV